MADVAAPNPPPPRDTLVIVASAGYLGFLLFGYFLLRPLREAMGIRGGADHLPWLMTATLAVMFLANPLHAWVFARWPRWRAIPGVGQFFVGNLVVFALLFLTLPGHGGRALGYVFYVWLSVFNLFVISVFWSLQADVFTPDRARRVFPMIAAGGTLGATLGAFAVRALDDAPPAALMGLAILAFELAFACMAMVSRRTGLRTQAADREPSRDLRAGLRVLRDSPRVQLIGGYVVLYAIASTLIYLAQGAIVEATFASDGARREAFATIDLWTNLLTLALQLLVTGPLLNRFGPTVLLLVVPLITAGGFLGLALAPSFAVVAALQIARRAAHHAVDRPTREWLYTPLSTVAKYQAKPFVDTFVYRAGDAIGTWTPAALAALALPLGAATAVIASASCVVAWALGRSRAV